MSDPCTMFVWTDNQAVYDGYSKGRMPNHRAMDDLWGEVWDLWELAMEAGWIIVLRKIKSHLTISDIGIRASFEDRQLSLIHI